MRRPTMGQCRSRWLEIRDRKTSCACNRKHAEAAACGFFVFDAAFTLPRLVPPTSFFAAQTYTSCTWGAVARNHFGCTRVYTTIDTAPASSCSTLAFDSTGDRTAAYGSTTAVVYAAVSGYACTTSAFSDGFS